MATLRERLLDGKVVGETFNIYNPEMLGENPVENYRYTVLDLKQGKGWQEDEALLIAKGEDGTAHEYPLVCRLEDKVVESQES